MNVLSRGLPALLPIMLLAGCDRSDPPMIRHLECRSTTSAKLKTMVFALDTGRETARWINGTDAREVPLKVNEYRYAFALRPPGRGAIGIAIGRFDGAMVIRRAAGSNEAPFEQGSCTLQPSGARL